MINLSIIRKANFPKECIESFMKNTKIICTQETIQIDEEPTIEQSYLVSYEQFIENQNRNWHWKIVAKKYGSKLVDDKKTSETTKCSIAPFILKPSLENILKYPSFEWCVNNLIKKQIYIENMHLYKCSPYYISKYATAAFINKVFDKYKLDWDVILKRIPVCDFIFCKDEFYTIENYVKYKHYVPWSRQRLANMPITEEFMKVLDINDFDCRILLKRDVKIKDINHDDREAICADLSIPMAKIIKFTCLWYMRKFISRPDFGVKEAHQVICAMERNGWAINKYIYIKFRDNPEFWPSIIKTIRLNEMSYVPLYMLDKVPFNSPLSEKLKIPSEFYIKNCVKEEDFYKRSSGLYKKIFLDLIIKKGIREPFSTIINKYIYGSLV